MRRRTFITGAAVTFAALPLGPVAGAATRVSNAMLAAMRENWAELVPANVELPKASTPLSKGVEQWQSELERSTFEVLFEEATERPFTSKLNHEKRKGVYVCAACDLPLFTSEMKFDSGTGWPSFFTHIPGHLGTKSDFRLVWPRTEYHCVRCKGHQGHVFKDGPRPTGERWCNNGVALRFLPV